MEVRLLAATELLLTALRDDRDRFGELIGSPAPERWPEFPEAIDFTLEYLRGGGDPQWSMHFFLDAATGRLLDFEHTAVQEEGTVWEWRRYL